MVKVINHNQIVEALVSKTISLCFLIPRINFIFDFFLNVYTDLAELSDKNNIILKRRLLCSNLLSLV